MSTMLANRRSTFGISCVRCHEELIAPDKSEYRAGTHIRHLWHCSNCSARFESIEQIPVDRLHGSQNAPPGKRRAQQARRHRGIGCHLG
jgi:hypothetical protein